MLGSVLLYECNLRRIVFALCVLTCYSFRPSFHINRATQARIWSVPKHKVILNHGGVEHTLEVAEDETILDASLDAGIDLPYDCKLGVCLVCSCKVQSGQIDQEGSALDDEVMQQGYALTCMSYPRSDAVITTVEDEELVNAQFGDKY